MIKISSDSFQTEDFKPKCFRINKKYFKNLLLRKEARECTAENDMESHPTTNEKLLNEESTIIPLIGKNIV